MAEEDVGVVEEASEAKPGRRKNLMFGGILLAVMVLEGVAAVVLVKSFGPQPATTEAESIGGLNPAEGEKPQEEVEIEIVTFRAQNERARQVVMYDLTVFASVSEDKAEEFKKLIERKKATIQDRFSGVIRGADPQVLAEPDRATLRQQFQRELADIIGDEEMILKILIPSMVPYRA